MTRPIVKESLRGMGHSRISKEQWDRLLESFRVDPHNISIAQRRAGVSMPMARNAYYKGWASPEFATTPIKVLLDNEKYEAEKEQARKQKQQEELREKAKKHLGSTLDESHEREREAQAVRAAISASISALAVTGSVSKARVSLAQHAAEQIVSQATAGQIDWKDAVSYLTKLQWLDTRAVHTLKMAMEALRMHLDVQSPALDPNLPVDAKSALQALGSEQNLKQAIIDLANNQITPIADKLIDFQIEQLKKAAN